MAKDKMNASISLDLDNQWAYMKVHGDEGWNSYPSYFDKFLPHGLKMLEKYNLKITFFIVGRDADDEKNRDVISEIPNYGHEVGNHSYNHEAAFNYYNNITDFGNWFSHSNVVKSKTKFNVAGGINVILHLFCF